jgi:hypothetical protein
MTAPRPLALAALLRAAREAKEDSTPWCSAQEWGREGHSHRDAEFLGLVSPDVAERLVLAIREISAFIRTQGWMSPASVAVMLAGYGIVDEEGE